MSVVIKVYTTYYISYHINVYCYVYIIFMTILTPTTCIALSTENIKLYKGSNKYIHRKNR